MKKIVIIEDNAITGVQYGTIDIPENEVQLTHARTAFENAKKIQAKRTAKIRSENTKHK